MSSIDTVILEWYILPYLNYKILKNKTQKTLLIEKNNIWVEA